MNHNDEGTYSRNEERVLVFLPESQDAGSIPAVLAEIGAASMLCATPEDLCTEIGRGAGALMIEEENLSLHLEICLESTLESQPSWSELPIIILVGHGPETEGARDALLLRGDVTLVERPVRVSTLVAVVRSALRSRKRQYLVRDQLHALEESEDRLAAANRELEAFNYTVAHDLRKPLTVINGYAQFLKEICGDALDVQCRTYVQETYEGTLRMNKLIDALLDFSSMARREPKREPVNVSDMCEEIASELQVADPDRRVSFRIQPGIIAEGDPDLLRVVLNNIFGNAWKYTSYREEGVIEFGATDVGPKRTYYIRDNGLGFDPAEAESIFAPFQRLERGQEVGGLGIGLATVARIIQRHGGKVWAEAEQGKGATFYFTLN